MLFAVKPSSNSLEKTFGDRLIAPTTSRFCRRARGFPRVFRNQTGAFWRPAERCKIAAGFFAIPPRFCHSLFGDFDPIFLKNYFYLLAEREVIFAVMFIRYFLYVRKSTDSEERQMLSIEAQLAEVRALAEKEHLSVVAEFTESMTAKMPGRPIFNQMIARIGRGEAQGILSWHPDRLARNSIDGGRIVYLLDCGKLTSLKFPAFWFENTPQGKFMMSLAFGQSKLYVDSLSENVRRGIRQKLRRGEWPGWAPIGYLNDKTSRKIVVDPTEGPRVRRLFETYASGRVTLNHLRDQANEWGMKSRTRKPLHRSHIHTMLSCPFYFGFMKHAGEIYQGTHEPLVSKDLFDQVQSVLHRLGRTHISWKHHFAFLGLAKCVTCDGAITAERQKGWHYYRCSKKRGKCPEPYIREENFADQIQRAIAAVALPDDTFQKMLAALVKEQEESSQPIEKLKAETRETVGDISKKLDRLLDAHLDGTIEKVEYLSKKELLLNEKLRLEERLRKLEQTRMGWIEPAKSFVVAAHRAASVVKSDDPVERKEFLKKIGSNLRLGAKTLRFDYEKPWDILAKNQKNENWSGRLDLNQRPLGPEPSALPG